MKRRTANAQAETEHAPTRDRISSYIRLPEGVKRFVPKADETRKLRFLAWEASAFNPSFKKGEMASNLFLFVHANLGADNETMTCPQKARGKRCPQCENFTKLSTTHQRGDKEFYNKVLAPIKVKNRELFLV